MNRLKDFLKDDLKELADDKVLMNNNKLQTFVYYWQQHYINI